MRAILTLMAMALLPPTSGLAASFDDDAGRNVALPDSTETVLAAGHPASILLFTLAPERQAGWTRRLSEASEALLPARAAELPALGRLTGRGDTANIEVVLSAEPDLIVDYGSVTETTADLADRVQDRVGIPYLLLDGRFDRIPAAYRRLGQALGLAERGEELAAEARRLLDRADALRTRIPDEDRARVYYARGRGGFDTGLRGSLTTEALERVGGVNVADVDGEGNLVTVSIEQILQWDPEVIITIEPDFPADAHRDARWWPVQAVRGANIHLAPDLPFGWFDRPPSVNRLLGLEWLGRLLYPEHYDGDFRDEVRRFFRVFYHREPTNAELDRLLERALPE